jgi:hypothetical protein
MDPYTPHFRRVVLITKKSRLCIPDTASHHYYIWREVRPGILAIEISPKAYTKWIGALLVCL